MENVIAPPVGNVSRRRAPDGRKLLLIFGNGINSTLVKYFKEGRWFCVHKLALGMALKICSAERFVESAGQCIQISSVF